MTQVFKPRTSLLLKLGLLGVFGLCVVLALVYRLNIRSDAVQAAPIEQPVPFSHKHHVRDVGLDCRYCHTSVEKSAFAGFPPVSTCMTCHSQLFTDSPVLRPIVEAYRTGHAVQWNRVHDLPDFAYFDHSIHVAKGVGCVTCHGHVDDMPLTARVVSLDMQWCLECHRHPEKYLRPKAHEFDMEWPGPASDKEQEDLGRLLRQYNQIRDSRDLTSCATCHR